ncbi:RNA-directed DNA polymerase, eukaryota [Tanacetum coccineum]|uniref:RNA-directed DNA polymerase, eukaryota n=1 Tax=Tanacetum coccineum TaxID=301880 RepID=A0ABQ5I250_9ASTR
MFGGIWCDKMDSIKRVAFSHFSTRFVEPCNSRPLFRSNKFRRLTVLDALSLESAILMEEVRQAVWSCSGSKAPGPYGINFNFIKKYDDIMRNDFFTCIKQFETFGQLVKGCNASFISLVPKVQDPIEMCNYRPISLIGCVYKVIVKVLATRLSKVMPKIISSNQTTFISCRQILDGVLIANEIFNYAKKVGMNLLLFKVDFEKAFDCVNWKFLLDIMMQMGFGNKWCKWIHGCLSSASISVLINGLLQMNFLCSMLPLTYLRLSVGKDMSRVNAWNDVVKRFTKRLSSWKAKILSIRGHYTLVKAVLGSLPLYCFSLFRAPDQEKGFAVAALKNELRKLTGNSVNTKFVMPSILGKPFASQVDVSNDLSKPVTTHHLPKRRESAPAKPHYMIATSSSRWVPTGKTFASSTTKVESEPPNGSNADIPNQCESEQALNVSAAVQASVVNVKWRLLKITLQAPFLNVQMMSVHISSGLVLHQMTSDHNRSELGIQDHSNEPSSSKLVHKVVP